MKRISYKIFFSSSAVICTALLLLAPTKTNAVSNDLMTYAELAANVTRAKAGFTQLAAIPSMSANAADLNAMAKQLNTVENGINMVNRIAQMPALQGIQGVNSVQNFSLMLQNAEAITSLPIFENVPGMSDLKSQINTLWSAPTLINQIQGVMSNPSIYNIQAVAQMVTQTGGLFSSVTSTISDALGLSSNSTTKDVISKVVSDTSSEYKLLNSVLGSSEGQALSGLTDSSIKAAVSAVEKVSGSQVLGTLALSNCGTSIDSQISDALVTKILGSTGLVGQGVPVIEQRGALLTASVQTKALNDQMCKYLKEIRDRVTVTDPAARVQALQNTYEQSKTMTKYYTSGRKTDSGSYISFTDRSAYVGEKVTAKGESAIQDIENSQMTAATKSAVIETLRKSEELRLNPEKEIALRFSGTKPDTSNPKEGDLVLHSEFANNPLGALYVASAYKQKQQEIAEEEAKAQFDVAGIAPEEGDCVKKSSPKTSGTASVCIKRLVLRPSSVVASSYSAYEQAPLQHQINAQATEDAKNYKPITQEVVTTIIEPQKSSANRTSQWNMNDIFSALSVVCGMKPDLAMCTGQWGSSGSSASGSVGAGNIYTGGTTNTTVTPGIPSLTLNSQKTVNSWGSDYSTITWSGENIDQCVTTSDWSTWGIGGTPTASSTLIYSKGEALTNSGAQIIYHPSIFKASVSVVRDSRDTDYTTDPANQSYFTYSFTDKYQIGKFVPNMSNIHLTDHFTLSLNTLRITNADPLSELTPKGVVLALKNAKVNAEVSGTDKDELSKYELDSESDGGVLIVRHAPETGYSFASSSVYSLQCTGPGGTVSKQISIQF